MNYEIIHTTEDDIERIMYRPHNPITETPIVMQHGMWHGAWCWETWQRALAERGWISYAHSLPGHGKSPLQRPIWRCTLDYYLGFLVKEMQQLDQTPILMGHSMGGALAQWYLKKVADNLPATILVASWNSHEMLSASLQVAMRDPLGLLHQMMDGTASAFVLRNPQVAKKMLISENAILSPEALHKKLGRESMLVLLQHNPPFWHPPKNVQTPLLWILPEADGAVLPTTQRRSAAYYDADIISVPNGAHNVMMEKNYNDIADQIHKWLVQRVVINNTPHA